MFHIFGINMLWFMTSPVTFVLNWNFQPYYMYTLQFQSIQHYTLLFNTAEKHIFFLSILTYGWYLSWIVFRKRKAKKKKLSLFKHVHKTAKVTNSSVMSVCLPACLPVCLSGQNNSAPTGQILWNWMCEYFSKICWENSLFLKIWQEQQLLYIKANVHLW